METAPVDTDLRLSYGSHVNKLKQEEFVLVGSSRRLPSSKCMVNVSRSRIQGRLRNLKSLCLHNLQKSGTNSLVLIILPSSWGETAQNWYFELNTNLRVRVVSLVRMKMLDSQVFIPKKDVIVLCNNVWVHKPLCKPPDALPEDKLSQHPQT